MIFSYKWIICSWILVHRCCQKVEILLVNGVNKFYLQYVIDLRSLKYK